MIYNYNVLKLRDWIDKTKINWDQLSINPNSINLLENNLKYINWELLSENTEAKDLIEKNLSKINWKRLSKNPSMLHILEKHESKIDLENLAFNKNPNAEKILRKYNKYWYKYHDTDYIDENNLSSYRLFTPNPIILNVLENNLDRISNISLSKNPNAISLLEKYPNIIDWNSFSSNPNGIELLEKNKDKINWYYFSQNPAIFCYDYEFMKKRCSIIKEEICIKVFHPKNFGKLWDDDDYVYC